MHERNEGYKIFNGNQIVLRLDKLSNMDLYIAYGDTLATSTLNTTQLKINDTAKYDVQNRVFIAAVPKNGSTSTAFKMTFHIEPFVTDRNKLDDDKAALLSLI